MVLCQSCEVRRAETTARLELHYGVDAKTGLFSEKEWFLCRECAMAPMSVHTTIPDYTQTAATGEALRGVGRVLK